MSSFALLSCVCGWHIRRIKTEDKAKVVDAVWGIEFIQFLATQDIFQQDVYKEK